MMFRVLGPLEVETDDGPIPLPGQRPRALLTALLLEPNAVVPVYRLVEALWGEEPPGAPANALQQVVARLRIRLGPVGTAIVTRPPGYVLVADPASVDAQCFESDYRAARSVWSTDPVRAGALLDDALRWWRGPAYGEFADGFAGPAAARLEELRLSALEDRAALFVQSGAATDAIATAREVMAREPLRERPVELLMRALHIDGRAGEALEVFREYRELLADELGLDPGPQLRDLETQILQNDPGTARAAAATDRVGCSRRRRHTVQPARAADLLRRPGVGGGRGDGVARDDPAAHGHRARWHGQDPSRARGRGRVVRRVRGRDVLRRPRAGEGSRPRRSHDRRDAGDPRGGLGTTGTPGPRRASSTTAPPAAAGQLRAGAGRSARGHAAAGGGEPD